MNRINDDFWNFVGEHLNADVSKLRLKYHNTDDLGFDVGFAITQIECRQKFGKKLSETLCADNEFLFPDIISGEQSTSDRLAEFHCSLAIQKGKSADLTAGLGIDTFHLAKCCSDVIAVEINSHKADILIFNTSKLFADNISVINADCRDYINNHEMVKFDTIFIDPARRTAEGERVYSLSQCQPDVITMLPRLKEISNRLIVKMSPMLDISQTISDFGNVSKIITLGTTTECKELIAVIDSGIESHEPTISAVTLSSDSYSEFSFTSLEEMSATVEFGIPHKGDFLYEPYPVIMKAAPFKLFAQRFGLKKMSANSHVYFSAERVSGIPAKTLEIIAVLPYASSVIKRLRRTYPVISIACRNFDIPADKLRAKLSVSDGGSLRLMATKDVHNRPMMIIAQPL